ncbi:class A beta-lactamase [Acinetobacter colistiniresistens]|uniref:Beta-lactamase n=1 Tax=Acinetobacter colistiniresistens TaxID=280145 RepID=A0A558ERX5_9GAMM|nr:class A beta-lactamase [Acinetobacter colistiniresistens]TVT76077.1 class A beta-lactamase [Acinetobacter colistiniresistens]
MRSLLKSAITVVLFGSSLSVTMAATLEEQVKSLSEKGWQVGVSILDMENKRVSINGDKRFPLDSTVKALACAHVLAQVDAKKLTLDHSKTIRKKDLVTYSPVVKDYVNKKLTIKQACEITTAYSDNTAANFAIEAGGGPAGLTSFMRSIGDEITRSDRYEPDLVINPEGDMRDTTSPNAMSDSMKKLLMGDVLSKSSKEQLKEWMIGNKVADNMLRAALPKGWKIADRTGASDYGIRGITSMVWSENHAPVFISIYVRKSETSLDERSAVIKLLSEHIVKEHLLK